MTNKKNWVLRSGGRNHESGIEDIISLLLSNRGLDKKKEKELFVNPKLEDVTIDSVGIDKKQLQKTLRRITKAISHKEQVIVYGDYDVDGITGTAILWETLHNMSANVMPYIPHRIDEGYGLSEKGIDNLFEKYPDTKLIITVDNGIVANKAVEYANNKGIEVIITDHHMPNEGLKNTPDAFSIVHTTALCGAGVALLLSQQLKIQDSNFKIHDDDHLELVALATIADLVPLVGANRTFVKFGLERLKKTKRIGIKAIFTEAGIDNSLIRVYEIGHVIAPRLNAAGRIGNGMDSLRLLCTKDKARAFDLATNLGRVNRTRQILMGESAKHAVERIKNPAEAARINKLLFVSDTSYREGVIGLIAGKLVEEFYRPAIVISVGEKKSKGSVRSIKGFNIIEFLRTYSVHFVNVGGHPMAAGFTIETQKIAALQKILESKAEELLTEELLTKKISIDCQIDFSIISDKLFEAIQSLEPFGMGNPEPIFLSKKVKVDDFRKIGKEKNHLKLKVFQNNKTFDAIAFGMGEFADGIKTGDSIDIVYSIEENLWNGRKSLQLKIKDIQVN